MNDREKWVRILGENMFTTDAYRDEPILRTAASMKNYMPPQYREMRRLALQNGARSRSAEEIFYRQAKFMEDFEDEYDYGGDFVRYFPTYQSMSDMQMRGYFSWRTQVRRGSVRKTSLSFVFIYLYELINGIGWTDAADGFAKLQSFCETYMTLDARIFRYAQMWMRDFVIYYDLDPSLRAMYFPPETAQMRDVLRAWETADDDALFSALCACSSYNLERSRFYRVCAQPIRAVTCRAYRAWAEYYEKNRKFTLFEALIGKPFTTPYSMFSAAVFYPQPTHPDADVQIDACTSFCCRGGKWTYTRIWGSSEGARQIGMLLKAVDAAMRAQYAYEHPLKSAKAPAYLEKIIAKSIEQARQAQAKQAQREVKIDLAKLQDIRDAADITRGRLIVDEEDMPQPEQAELPPDPAAALSDPPEQPRPFDLSETECAVLRALLNGGDANAPLRGTGQLLSVLIDSINEKCFDVFGDTVVVFETDEPSVPEDYAEELRGILS